ncbi:MAG: histidine ammonia-lyase [Tissierellales bacterium]|jgi:histidine ammonia-lyase|nr:histidine ammonia-lyase [Tissierellales bacterium]
MTKVIINGKDLKIESFISVTKKESKVVVDPAVLDKINESRRLVDRYVDESKVVYGITTGFGKFSDVFISKEESKQLQENLIKSHACGVGNPLPEEIVRGIMLLRANALVKGCSGIRLSTIEFLVELINRRVHPVIPEKGSLGASGDLAPLAHMVLVMLGFGEAYYNGERMEGKKALSLAGLEPIHLTSKEGLALINGTQVMTSIGAMAVYEAMKISKLADLIGAMTVESLNGITDAYDERIHLARGQKGQIEVAKNLREYLKNSEYTTHQGELRVQDAYTLRCIPQIHGASLEAINYVKEKVEIEMNAATDNPLIFTETEDVISGGNFHGQPMALAFDFLSIALSEYANVSERRLERLVNPALNNGLPAFLVKNGGLNSGFMIVQYSAASLVSENKILAHPASVDSIPSSANQEDHVSMGTIGARKALEIMKNTKYVLSMEAMAAAQAIDLRERKKMGNYTEMLYNEIRDRSCMIEDDLVMNIEIEKVSDIFESKILEKL